MIIQGKNDTHSTTIHVDMLTDNVLIDIFDFYRKNYDNVHRTVWKWHILAHVCRRWRQIVFDSPHRLDLTILCTYGTPVKKFLGIWPNFPIAIDYRSSRIDTSPDDEENVIAALEHPDRVGYLGLDLSDERLETLATLIREPFPVLRHLVILGGNGDAPLLPAEFLGGSAPHVQNVLLRNIAFPTLPTLLLSAKDLVELKLSGIPPTGYVSPEVMVACLADLPKLKTLVTRFQPTTPRPDRIPLPLLTRTVLPALVHFQFTGSSQYLEDLAARIDCPQLNLFFIACLSRFVDIQVTQLSKLFDHLVGPKISPFRHAEVRFDIPGVKFLRYYPTDHPGWDCHLARTIISCQGFDWQVSRLAQMLSQFSAILSTVVHLKVAAQFSTIHPSSDADDLEWLHLLNQFCHVQALYLSRQFAVRIARALKSIKGEMVAKALSSLDLICLEDQPSSSIEKFIAIRRLSGRPVAVVGTEAEFDQRLESYIGK